MNDRDFFDEASLRRALRFEADENVPRFDVAAIAAAAHRTGPTRRTVAVAIGASVVVGVIAGGAWSAILAAAPGLGEAAMATVLDAVVAAATVLLPLADIASQPAVPISLLAALGIAILHERRERAHVHAS